MALRLEEPIQADLDILTVLAGRPEPYVLRPVFFGLRRLTKVSEFRTAAISLITGVAIGNRKFLAKEYCGIFGPYGISPSLLDQAGVEKMLANLVEVDELDHDSFGRLRSECVRYRAARNRVVLRDSYPARTSFRGTRRGHGLRRHSVVLLLVAR